MTAIKSYQLILLLFLMSFDSPVCSDDTYSTHTSSNLTGKPNNPPTSLALTTTSEQGDGYGSIDGNNNDLSATSGQKKGSLCASYDDHPSAGIELSKRDPKLDAKKGGSTDGAVLPSKNSTMCPNYCFTLWVADQRNKSNVTVSKQGCWIISEGKDCQLDNCISNLPPRQNNTHFCCCSGYMCNTKYQDVYNPAEHITSTTQATPVAVGLHHDHSYKTKTIIIALVSVVSVSLVVVFLYLAYRLCLTSKPTSPQSSSVARVETPEPLLPEFSVNDLKIEDVLVRGRYSEIRKGWLRDKEVAVKIYQPHHRQYYYNERNAFTQPFMDHENIIKFYGAKEQEDAETNLLQYIIVTKFIPLGSLTSYLKHNTVDWYKLCNMCRAVSRGLAYLHTDIQKGDLFKPAIAHRDLNTRNILVNHDLTCMISDLGFSVGMIGSKIIKNGIPENAEQATLADVGTLRYMAPEVFDGAVNLRDCEASLKQIDVYALGLVIWEIASRCIDLYQGAPVPEYQLPFQAEAGTHPTFEEMQVLVVKYKTRPRFPEVWKDANPAVRSLKETIEDCWDTDAEARLTSLCVQERVTDMAALWILGTKHRGVTPTLNATMNLPECSQNGVIYSGSAVVSNGVTYLPSFVDRNNETNEEAGISRQRDEASRSVIPTSMRCREDSKTANNGDIGVTAPLISNMGHLASSDSFEAEEGRVRSWLQDQSMSGSTMDTLLPPTPSLEEANSTFDVPPLATQASDHHPPVKASNVMIAINKAVILHPNQGRNPTVERNTHKRSDEELTVSGNVLIGPGNNIPENESGRNNRRGSLGTRSAPPNRTGDGGSFDGTDAVESSSLMQNDSLGQHHVRPRNTPIPYFQNHVHGENIVGGAVSSYLTRPKLANVSGNRSSYLRLQGEESCPQSHSTSCQTSEKTECSSLKCKLSKFIRPRDFGMKFSQMVFGGKHKKSQNSASSNLNMDSGIAKNENINRTTGQYINSGLDASPISRSVSNISTTTSNPVAMEVQIVNGSVVTRTCNDINTNKPLSHQNGNTIIGPQGRLSATNVMRLGVLANPSHEELPSPSLFPKGSGDSVVNDASYQSELEQGHAVPLQHLVIARSATDYGSMRPIILNQAYGLDSDIEMSAPDLSGFSLAASVNDIQNTAISSDNHQCETNLNLDTDLGSASLTQLTDNHPDISSAGQASLTSGGGGNYSLSSSSNVAAAEPALAPACDCGPLNTVIQSPTNKAISPLNKPLFLHAGLSQNVIVKKGPQEIPQGTYSGQNSTVYPSLQNHHTDTKGGNSIMHCFHMEASINHPKDTSRHPGWPAKKAVQLEVTTSPQKTCINNPKHAEITEDVTTASATQISPNVNHKSSQELSHSQGVSDLEEHQNHLPGRHVDPADIVKIKRDHNWQEIKLSKSVSLTDKNRPQSLSLKGHNYNQKRGRSASSSSLSSALTQGAETFVQNNSGIKTSDESRSLTRVVPNVTLDRRSPLTQNSTGREPATIPTTVAVSTNICSIKSTGSSDDNSHVVKYSMANNGTVSNLSTSQSAMDGSCFVSIDCQSDTTTTTTSRSNDNAGAKLYATVKNGSDSSEKIRKRIKTPVSFKKGRLSLYDDRLMTHSLGFVSLADVDGTNVVGGCEGNNNSGSGSTDLCGHSGIGGAGLNGKHQSGNDGKTAQMRRADYHKMIKSESDLVV